MVSPSVSTHRGLAHWQGLLLVVSLLILWGLPPTTQLSIVSTSAAEGEDVLLRVHKKPFNFIGFKWYRGKGANPSNKIASYSINQRYFAKGLAHSSREEIHYDGSLLLRKVTKDDTGLYTVEVYIRGFKKETAFGWLEVHEAVRLHISLASNITLTSFKTSTVLTCYSNEMFT